MMIAVEEWEALGPELVRRNICSPIDEEEIVVHNGSGLVNGMFGVTKGKTISVGGVDVNILRLIINLVLPQQVAIAYLS